MRTPPARTDAPRKPGTAASRPDETARPTCGERDETARLTCGERDETARLTCGERDETARPTCGERVAGSLDKPYCLGRRPVRFTVGGQLVTDGIRWLGLSKQLPRRLD
jgi:hypothetical protein